MTGLLHSHSGLAYLVLFTSLLNVALALTVSKNPIAVAKVILWSHRIVIWGGRLNIIVGTVFWYQLGFASVGIVGIEIVHIWREVCKQIALSHRWIFSTHNDCLCCNVQPL